MNKLITETLLQEDIGQNGEGLDKKVLTEAVNVAESEFSAPMDGASFIMKLMEEDRL